MPCSAAKPRASAARLAASSSASFWPASSVYAHIGACPVARACSPTAARTSSSGCAPSIGIRWRRLPGRTEPSERPSRTPGTSAASRRIPDGSPAVHTVMLRMSIACALGSESTRIAWMTRSALASGSPMPWNSTPCTRAPPPTVAPRSRRMSRTCSTISQASRLRARPMRPVAQKAQASAQPTCELTHAEYRPGRSSGMRTDSIVAPSSRRNAYFTNGSSALARRSTSASVLISPAERAASSAARRTVAGARAGSSPRRCASETMRRASVRSMPHAPASSSGSTAWRARRGRRSSELLRGRRSTADTD
ncbi:uncharacterized protein SOCE836_049330 [Sorangium cellulosum]|uniref:Uncharacterized protein n=1 Tax=Sorangium cellulosum TaxID=56 RepID=A0A4P2QRX6_SORCE|nr:uncharacterized protein SOCE836_049330 [Sorangium cellulosum]